MEPAVVSVRVAPLATVIAVPPPEPSTPPKVSVPLFTFVAPVYVLFPLSVSVPVPFLFMATTPVPPAPFWMAPLKVLVPLFPPIVNVLVLLASVEEAKFRRQVRPGDQLLFEMKMLKRKASIAKMTGVVTVDGVVVAEATMMCVLADREQKA